MNVRRVFYRVANPVRRLYWFIVRPRTFGVKCLIEYNGRYLMIRNTYGKMHWTFPGGGMRRTESPEAALRREAREEVSVAPGDVTYLGSYFNIKEHKRDTVHCYYARVEDSEIHVDPVEILEAAWFLPQELPTPCSPAVAKVLDLYAHYTRGTIRNS